MGRPRIQLQKLLTELLGSSNVYFEPPEDIKMKYPAIVYHRDYVSTQYADNKPYRQDKRYEVTVIDADPDSAIPDKVGALPQASFDRPMVVDKLHHSIYTLYF